MSKVRKLRHLVLIAAALLVAGCAIFKRPAPLPSPPPVPSPVSKPVQPRAKPASPAQAVQAAPNPAEGCRLLALQREADARKLGRDARAQRIVRDETYADCMSNKPAQ